MSGVVDNEAYELIRQRLTLVFVSGLMTLADGSQVDSRQPGGDKWVTRATGKAVVASSDWWRAVSAIVLPTLGEKEYALVVGARTIARPGSSEKVRRASLKTILKGKVGQLSVKRSGLDDKLPDDHQAQVELRAAGAGSMGFIGSRISDDATWRFFDGNVYYLRLIARLLDVRVVVDATGEFLAGAYGYTGTGTLSVKPLAPACRAPQLVVMPDTAQMRQIVRQIELGLINEAPAPEVSPAYDATNQREPRDFLNLEVLRAECCVSGLFRQGRWEDPSNLEAARRFLMERFDLKVGLWDLALNPVLRDAVLEPNEVPSRPPEPIVVPAVEHARAQRVASGSASKKIVTHRAQEHVLTALGRGLRPVGWRTRDGRLSCPLTKPMANWPNSPKFPLVMLRLAINKTSTRVEVWQWFYNQLDINDFVSARRADFEAIAGGVLESGDRSTASLFTLARGWSDTEADWAAIAGDLAGKTVQWTTLLGDLVAACESVRATRFGRGA